MSTKQKSAFFEGTWSKFSAEIWRFEKKFLDFLTQLWQLVIEFPAILSTKAIPLEAFE
jgi:hypothetical protein